MADVKTIAPSPAEGRVRAMLDWLEREPIHRVKDYHRISIIAALREAAPGCCPSEVIIALWMHVRLLREILGDQTALAPKPEQLWEKREAECRLSAQAEPKPRITGKPTGRPKSFAADTQAARPRRRRGEKGDDAQLSLFG